MRDLFAARVRVRDHRAKLVERELAAVEADARLLEENRSRRGQLDEQRGDENRRYRERKHHQGDADVDEALEREMRFVRRRGGEREERHAFQLFDLQARDAVLEEVHRHARADAELFAHQENLLHLVELLARDGEDDLVDRTQRAIERTRIFSATRSVAERIAKRTNHDRESWRSGMRYASVARSTVPTPTTRNVLTPSRVSGIVRCEW